MIKKKFFLLLILCSLLCGIMVFAGHEQTNPDNIDTVLVESAVHGDLYINGRKIDEESVYFSEYKEILVPLRAVFENLRAEVIWNSETETISIHYGCKNYFCEFYESIPLSGKFFIVKDEDIDDYIQLNPYSYDGLFININDRIYLRKDAFVYFLESAGCNTEIDYDNKAVKISEIDLLYEAEKILGFGMPASSKVENFGSDSSYIMACKISFDKKDIENVKKLLSDNLTAKSDERFIFSEEAGASVLRIMSNWYKWWDLAESDGTMSPYYRAIYEDSNAYSAIDANGYTEKTSYDIYVVLSAFVSEGAGDKDFLYLYCDTDFKETDKEYGYAN